MRMARARLAPSPGATLSSTPRSSASRSSFGRGARRGSSASPPPPTTTPASVVFVTGNEGKVERLRLALSLYCPSTADACDVEVRGLDLEIQEIQADTVLEVATAKAEAAFERLGVPLVVHDCGLVVRALNDWPGPYTKDANYKLGTEGLMALLAGVEDRAAGWDDVIAYVDDAGAVTTFAPDPNHRYVGEIAPEPPRRYRRFRGPERALGRTFVPTAFGLEECLADVSEEEYQRYRREAPSVWNDFARWWAETKRGEGE